jgi:hypothetical protein
MKKAKGLSGWFRKAPPFLRHKFTEPQFRPYVLAIGQFLLAWNDLHERLATLFAQAQATNVKQSLAIWDKTRSDRAKRRLLEAAIKHLPESITKQRPSLVKEIIWILGVVNDLEGARDDAAHGPLFSLRTANFYDALVRGSLESKDEVLPNTAFGNERAIRLNKDARNLLRNIRYANRRTLVLRDYVIAVDTAWVNVRMPWPDRPSLPDRSSIRPYTNQAKRRKQKSHARPPRS